MDFSITDKQKELLERLDRFCDENLDEMEIQRWLVEGNVPDSFLLNYYRSFGSVGLCPRPEGAPASVLTRVLVLERLGFRAGATLPIQGMMLDTQILSSCASEPQIELIQDALARTGRPGFCLAVTEPQSGSDSFNALTTATECDDGFIISGRKSFVSSGQYASYLVIAAHDTALDAWKEAGRKPLTFFLLPQDSAGLDAIPVSKVGQHLIPTAEIILNDVKVSKDAVVGERGQAANILLQSYEYGRICVCATSVGMAQAAFDQAVTFALRREIGGSSILSFQQIQEMVTDMQIKIDAMRALLYKTACALDERAESTRLDTALLKRFVPKTATEVADSAMQILGSIGYMSATKAARIWQECRGNRISEGTDQVMTIIAAKRIARRTEAEHRARPVWRF